MKIKHCMIASLALNVALTGLVLMQKGNYASQAEEAYRKTTDKYYSDGKNAVQGQNAVIENNAILWNLAVTANQQAKNSKDFATIEKNISQGSSISAKVSGTPDGKGKLRTVSWNNDYYIVASFDSDNRLTGIDVNALLGKGPTLAEEPLEEDASEEFSEE